MTMCLLQVALFLCGHIECRRNKLHHQSLKSVYSHMNISVLLFSYLTCSIFSDDFKYNIKLTKYVSLGACQSQSLTWNTTLLIDCLILYHCYLIARSVRDLWEVWRSRYPDLVMWCWEPEPVSNFLFSYILDLWAKIAYTPRYVDCDFVF